MNEQDVSGKIVAVAVPTKVMVYPRTRLSKEHPQVLTKLSLNLTRLNWNDILTYATERMVIKWQDAKRAKQLGIPEAEEWEVPVPGTRQAVSFDAQAALVKGFGLEMAQKLIKKHGSAEAAFEVVKAMLEEEEESEE